MTQYMLSVYMSESDAEISPDEMQQIFADVDVFNDQLRQQGHWVFAGGLHPADTATVVKVDGDETITTDGPYAETKEQIGGFWVIDAPDLDAALDWATKGSRACRGAVEVRPFQDEPES